MPTKETRQLIENPLLTKAQVLLQTSNYTQKDYTWVTQAISEFENACQDEGSYSRAEVDDAVFFLCSFLDERFCWKKSLVFTFYESNRNKADDFFDRLKKRMNDARKNVDLLELAYICLSLGYRGKFASSDTHSALIDITSALYTTIRELRHYTSHLHLSTGMVEKQTRSWPLPPIWLTVMMAAGILILLFIPYHNRLNHYMQPILNSINRVAK